MFRFLLRVISIIDNVSHKFLQWFEPHTENGAQLAESVHVTWVVILVFCTKKCAKSLGKVIAILRKWIIVAPVPKFTKIGDYIVHFIVRIVCFTNH